jgi:hypothetical protein
LINELTSYQIYGLKKLASFRKKFYNSEAAHTHKNHAKKTSKELIQEFVDIFCAHNFADTDYSIIQQEPLQFDTMDEWIRQASVSAILKSFTYFIWTDKIVDGYFKGRIDNHTIEKLLLRLETAIKEEIVAA